VATNLELKCRLASCAEAHDAARRLGAALHATITQTDTYFRVPHGRLKLRTINGTTAELIQYNRPDEQDVRWSSYTRVPIADPAVMEHALAQALGIRCVVEKLRTVYLHGTARIHVDEVSGLGSFLEFEVVETAPEAAAVLMEELRKAFSVRQEALIAGSYADMLEAERKLNKTPLDFSGR
jgi:predicted adenylyl cyclase CyaB